MRIAKITSYYPQALNIEYSANSDLAEITYNEQLNRLQQLYTGNAYFRVKNLINKGHEAIEIITNALPLQKKWAEEQNVENNAKTIVLNQLSHFKPDVVFIQDTFNYGGSFVDLIRKSISSIKLVIGNCCSPYSPEHIEVFKPFDFLIVCSGQFKEEFESQGLKCHVLFHAFEPEILEIIDKDNHFPESDFFFSGTINSDKGFHRERTKLLEDLVRENVNIAFYGNLQYIKTNDLIMRQLSYLLTHSLKAIGLSGIAKNLPLASKAFYLNTIPRQVKVTSKLRSIAQPPVFGIDMYKAMSKSKIGFNIHVDIARDAANVRLFDTTGVGSCLLTDEKNKLNELFVIDKEVVTYRNERECFEKVKWLLSNPAEMKIIAKAGQQRCLRDHNYNKRADQFLLILEKYFR
jgi:spore maturation protein CgeB